MLENNQNINKETEDFNKKANYRNFKQIINTFYQSEMYAETRNDDIISGNHDIKLCPNMIFDKFYKEIRIEIKIGKEKLYKIKNLPDFYNKFLNKEQGKYGSKLEFVHIKENFDEDSKKLLDFILKHAEIIKYINSSGNAGYRYYGKVISDNCIILSNSRVR